MAAFFTMINNFTMINKRFYVSLLAIFFTGILARAGFSFRASAAQEKEGVGKVVEVVVVPIDDDGSDSGHPLIPYDPEQEPDCEKSNKTKAGAESALFSHQAGLASYPRHGSMADAAERIPLIFDTLEASRATYLTNPDLGMATMADPDGRSRLTLKFHIETVDEDSFLPSALYFHDGFEAHYIYDANDMLRQVMTDDSLTDIIPLVGDEGYMINTYRRVDQVGAYDGAMYPILSGEVPYLQSKVYNPNPWVYDGHIEVEVTERFALGSTVVKIYSWFIDETGGTSSTTFDEKHPVEGSSPLEWHTWKRIVLTRDPEVNEPDFYNQVRATYTAVTPEPGDASAPTLALVSRDYERYEFVGVDTKRLVQYKTAVDAAGAATSETLITDLTYYVPTGNSLADGRPESVISSDGMWVKHEYDFANVDAGVRVYKTYTPFMDSEMSNLASARLETVTTDNATYTKVVTVAGQQVSKVIRTAVNYGNKLIVKTERSSDVVEPLISYVAFKKNATGTPFTNRIHSKVKEDGSVVLYAYADLGNRAYSEVIRSGAGTYDANGLVTSVTSGTETTTLFNAHGQAYELSGKDIDSSLNLESWSATEPGTSVLYIDLFGRPTRKFFNGNASDFEVWDILCCGIEESVTRSGVITSFERDVLKRVTQQTTLRSNSGMPIVTDTKYQGLTTTVERTAGGTTQLVLEVTRSLGGLTTTEWAPDADDELSQYSPANGDFPKAERTVRAESFLPSSGRSVTVTASDGTQTYTEAYRDGSRSVDRDPLGNATTFEYGAHTENGGGLWAKTTSPVTTQWVKAYTDALGRSFRTEYPDGAMDTRTYHPPTAPAGWRGKLAGTQDADENTEAGTGTVVAYTYWDDGDLAATNETIADGHIRQTTTDRNAFGGVVVHGVTIIPAYRAIQSVNGVVTSTTYQSMDGYRSATVSLDGQTAMSTSVPYDGAWTTASTSADGQVTIQTYADGLLVSSDFFGNDYDANGTNVAVESTLSTYDAYGRSLVTTDSRTGDTTVVGRLANGATTSVASNNGADITSYAYDPIGRLTATTLADGSITHNSYTSRGRTLATWGSQTYARLYQYDTLGRMSELRTYQDLAYGVEPEVTTTGFAKTTWHYDDQRGWLTEKNYDGETGNGPGNMPDYAYTPSGRLETRTWERGVVTTYEYDQGALGKVTYTNDPTGTPAIEYVYDDFGRMASVYQDASQTQGANSHAYEYDAGDLTLKTETIAYDIDANGVPALTRTLAPTYDGLLRPTGYALKDGATVETASTYTYDTVGRLHSVSETHQSPALDFVYSYAANSANLVESVLGPVHTVENTFEPHRDVLVTKENSITATNAVISHFVYTTNNIGQRTNLVTSGSAYAAGTAPSYVWSYNDRGELIQADDSSTANSDRAFQYDGIGNREKSVDGLLPALPGTPNYTANSLNQYTAIDTQNPVYDADGNATSYPLPAAPGALSTLVWNGENRLISAAVAGSSTSTSTYNYDFQGRRISKEVGTAAITRYIYEGWSVIAEYEGSILDRAYTWGADLSGSMQGAGGVGGLLAVHVGSANYYPTYDGNGNVAEYLDANGAVAAHFEYDGFGNETVAMLGSGVPELAHRFSTKPLDGEPGLYYYGYRSFASMNGRWLSRDPIEEKGGSNLFGFVGNDGVNDFDLLGQIGGGKCCNHSKVDQWALIGFEKNWFGGKVCDKGGWVKLKPGQCIGGIFGKDCEGMTCGGGFYKVKGLKTGACVKPGCDDGTFADRRWTPTKSGSSAVSPSKRNRYAPNTPPGYKYTQKPKCK